MDLWDLQIPDFKETFFLIFLRTNYLLHLWSEVSHSAVKGTFSFSTRTRDKQAVK